MAKTGVSIQSRIEDAKRKIEALEEDIAGHEWEIGELEAAERGVVDEDNYHDFVANAKWEMEQDQNPLAAKTWWYVRAPGGKAIAIEYQKATARADVIEDIMRREGLVLGQGIAFEEAVVVWPYRRGDYSGLSP